MLGRIAAAWGFIGVFLFLGSAIFKLAVISWQLTAIELELYHWLAMIGWVFFMGYYEGYRGFQQGFSPRVAARATADPPATILFMFMVLLLMSFTHRRGVTTNTSRLVPGLDALNVQKF